MRRKSLVHVVPTGAAFLPRTSTKLILCTCGLAGLLAPDLASAAEATSEAPNARTTRTTPRRHLLGVLLISTTPRLLRKRTAAILTRTTGSARAFSTVGSDRINDSRLPARRGGRQQTGSRQPPTALHLSSVCQHAVMHGGIWLVVKANGTFFRWPSGQPA